MWWPWVMGHGLCGSWVNCVMGHMGHGSRKMTHFHLWCLQHMLSRAKSGSDNSFQRYGHLKFSKMVASRHLGFGATRSRSIRSADLENLPLEPNMKWIGWPIAEIWPFEIFQNLRSVSWSSVLSIYIIHCYHTLLFATLGTWRARSKNK